MSRYLHASRYDELPIPKKRLRFIAVCASKKGRVIVSTVEPLYCVHLGDLVKCPV